MTPEGAVDCQGRECFVFVRHSWHATQSGSLQRTPCNEARNAHQHATRSLQHATNMQQVFAIAAVLCFSVSSFAALVLLRSAWAFPADLLAASTLSTDSDEPLENDRSL